MTKYHFGVLKSVNNMSMLMASYGCCGLRSTRNELGLFGNMKINTDIGHADMHSFWYLNSKIDRHIFKSKYLFVPRRLMCVLSLSLSRCIFASVSIRIRFFYLRESLDAAIVVFTRMRLILFLFGIFIVINTAMSKFKSFSVSY